MFYTESKLSWNQGCVNLLFFYYLYCGFEKLEFISEQAFGNVFRFKCTYRQKSNLSTFRKRTHETAWLRVLGVVIKDLV